MEPRGAEFPPLAFPGEPPEFAVLTSAYSVVGGRAVFGRATDLGAVDRRRTEIGLVPLAEDIRRRSLGETLSPTTPDQPESW